jgi:hypothetical protein
MAEIRLCPSKYFLPSGIIVFTVHGHWTLFFQLPISKLIAKLRCVSVLKKAHTHAVVLCLADN